MDLASVSQLVPNAEEQSERPNSPRDKRGRRPLTSWRDAEMKIVIPYFAKHYDMYVKKTNISCRSGNAKTPRQQLLHTIIDMLAEKKLTPVRKTIVQLEDKMRYEVSKVKKKIIIENQIRLGLVDPCKQLPPVADFYEPLEVRLREEVAAEEQAGSGQQPLQLRTYNESLLEDSATFDGDYSNQAISEASYPVGDHWKHELPISPVAGSSQRKRRVEDEEDELFPGDYYDSSPMDDSGRRGPKRPRYPNPIYTTEQGVRVKAICFTPVELEVMFHEICRRFHRYVAPVKTGRAGRSPRHLVLEEVAHILSSLPGGIVRLDRQVSERVRLEMQRIKQRIATEKNPNEQHAKSVPPLGKYLTRFDELYRLYWKLQENKDMTYDMIPASVFGIEDPVEESEYPDHYGNGETMSPMGYHLGPGTPSTVFSQSSDQDHYDTSGRADGTPGVSSSAPSEPSKHICQTCKKKEFGERMRVCISCAGDDGVELNEENIEEILRHAHCPFCAMEEHVDKGHATGKLLQYDKRTRILNELTSKSNEILSSMKGIHGEMEDAISCYSFFEQKCRSLKCPESSEANEILNGNVADIERVFEQLTTTIGEQVAASRKIIQLRNSFEAAIDSPSGASTSFSQLFAIPKAMDPKFDYSVQNDTMDADSLISEIKREEGE